jgi:predicted ATPase/class 3 adenylate cyclase
VLTVDISPQVLDYVRPASQDGVVHDNLPIGTVTFLFTDIDGSTRLLQTLGRQYREVLERHAAILRGVLVAHEGVEISTEGDAFFAVFRSASQAVAATVAAQRGLAGEPWPDGQRVRVRMGMHTGEGQLGGDSYVGLDVHRAARIAASGHGGQVLLSAATRSLVERALPEGVSVRDLGVHRLKDLEQPENLAQLIIAGLQQDFPPLRTLETPSSLPTEQSSFIGRQRELDEISALLATTRLLTLTGPGGTGKTRLAIRIGARVGSRLRDGVFFVDLSPLNDPALVGPTIARSLGLSDQAERPIVDLLKTYLEPRELLLVLDNFEHLLPAAEFIDGLLAAAPRVKALVTSRSILNLYGEQTFEVPPLALPDPADLPDLAELTGNEAVALFLERARAASPEFVLTKESARAIVEICVRLDGLPLAIELAASRIRVLQPEEILSLLQQHLPVLTGGPTNVPARQRTLRATIEWSYELLHPPEQRLFVRLAVFAGDCTLEAAEAVCNPKSELGLNTLDGLASLVDHSLVRRYGGPGESRFRMLETIREYGHDRLEADDTLDVIAARHSGYYRDLAEVAEAHFTGPEQVAWLDRFEREHDNVRAALSRALETRDAETGLRLAAAMWRFWLQRGYLREGRAWLEAMLALEPDVVSPIRARGFTAVGGLAYWLSDADATEGAYEASVRISRQLGDRDAEAEALYNLAFVPVMRGDYPESRRRFEASLALATEIGRPDLVAQNQGRLGFVEAIGGDPHGGLRLLEEALSFSRSADDRFQIAWTVGATGRVHRLLGQHREARARYLEGLRMHAEARNLPGIGATLDSIAGLESENGRHTEAMRLMGASATLTSTTGASAPLMFSRVEDVEENARQALGDEAVEKALAEGRSMTLDEAVAYAASLAD